MQQLSTPPLPWVPSRAEAERRLVDFLPRAGRLYAAQRNFDRGPAARDNVSELSPYVRHRVLTESELLAAVLDRHSAAAAEKFISEIFWRTYWKGWLEAHPAAWARYRAALEDRLADVAASPGLAAAYAAATGGTTGIDAFDSWSGELVATNYLHNHARMWFASIWTFTLQLPWELGADFFMRHLLDGDPASNTLSWRWVAGLQTRGKTYRASRDNIRRYTEGRFEVARPLAAGAPALDEPPVPLRPLPALTTTAAAGGAALFVVHDDDLHGDLRDLPAGVRGVCALRATAGRSPLPVSPAVAAFEDAVAAESVARLAAAGSAADLGAITVATGAAGDGADAAGVARALAAAAAACGADRIVAAYAPVGPVRDALDALRPALAASGVSSAELGRRYDGVAWPAATRGFFNLRSRIPAILTELAIGTG